jgi:pimeloyl-ACP methyl ester carboxylesterase
VIVITHGTSGLADHCAPSQGSGDLDYLIHPFAATGLPVIAPDYAGLGGEGVQGYGDGVDTGHSVLDAARALRKLVASGSLSPDIIVAGHSQGGGAALAAQSLASSYGADGTVRAVIPFAPGWQDKPAPDVGAYKYASLVPTNLALGVPATVAALYAYADQYNGIGPTSGGALFHPNVRTDVVNLIEKECVLELALGLPSKAPTFADLLDKPFLDGVVSCIETSGATCVDPAKSFLERMAAHYQPVDSAGPKILVIQGLKDAQATPERTACYVKQMNASGVTPEICTDAEANHFDVVHRNVAFARQWVGALLEGTQPPACTTTGLPACTQ